MAVFISGQADLWFAGRRARAYIICVLALDGLRRRRRRRRRIYGNAMHQEATLGGRHPFTDFDACGRFRGDHVVGGVVGFADVSCSVSGTRLL